MHNGPTCHAKRRNTFAIVWPVSKRRRLSAPGKGDGRRLRKRWQENRGRSCTSIMSSICQQQREAVKSLSATESAEALITGVFLTKGFPLKLVADRSTSWRNELWTAMCEALGIQLSMTVAYRAKANGMAERPHRYLNSFLRTLAPDEQNRWDRVLPYLTFAYCQGVCRTTGQTPHFLEFGRDLRGPSSYNVLIPKAAPMAQREYLARLRRRLHAAWKISEQTAAEVYRAAKDRYNNGRMDMILDVGRLVWVTQVASAPVLEERQSRRFLPRLTGPWRVLSRHENATDTYRLRHETTGERGVVQRRSDGTGAHS
uniref:Integrase catalytic domain-containing protein n=1 Tax=Spongospora subterranea TaxID=70186 RepID=A0A0H5R0R7_9EUKA|eukprot:CRZ07798.1 hypothetical protein [Spongospora subterranea]